MKMRVSLIVLASLGLCFTVLPDVASASGVVASSTPGTVSGTVKVIDAPTGFAPAYIGAAACPDTGPAGKSCANPTYALASNGAYSLSLDAGTYRVTGFYENNAFGGAFLSATHVVTVTSGGTTTLNLSVKYQVPASITGTLTVFGVPKSVSITQLEVLLCPSFAPYTGGTIPLACVSAYAPPSTTTPGTGTYSVNGLPPGTWTAFPSFCTETSCVTPNPNGGTFVTLVGGQTSTLNLTRRFLAIGQGFVSGSLTVTGAPAGFSAPVGVSACPASGTCQVIYGAPGNNYGLILSAGSWTLKGFYLASPFNNAIDGPATTVAVASREYVKDNLAIPYQVLGAATGTITITGLPAGTPITSYVLLACPSSEPWDGLTAAPECVSEFSGPGGFSYGPADSSQALTASPAQKPPAPYNGPAQAAAKINVYSVSTLTAGSWLLYPGYEDLFGAVLDPSPTSVTIAPPATTTKNLTVAYKTPTQGAVTGTVDVIGAPTGGTEAGAQACTAAPSGSTCQGEVEATAGTGGGYSLLLTPGTWWVRGFVYVNGAGGASEATSAAVEITLTAGQDAKENFAVTY